MATYYPYLSNQTEVISSTYIHDQMYIPQPSTESSYTEHFSANILQPKNEMEFVSRMGNSLNFEPNDGEQNLRLQASSLSLGTRFPPSINVPTYEYQYVIPNVEVDYDFEAYKSPTPMPMVCNAKYMKAVQELLDEVVNVKNIKQTETENRRKVNKFELFGSKEMEMKTHCDSSTKPSSEFSPLERQQLKVNLGNLCSMVDEVDQRYRKYCHQMQIVVSSFETMAGRGAATSYTALALCTISRQFRCLRDSINGQIIAVRQSLGEKDATTPNVEGKLTRLRIVNQQLRQQAAIQNFGAMRNSWRPQRGLPGNSVSVLRAWLFEHFLHPYPKDSEKVMLSRQTGLTRCQVANWFINARVRLWKPMVEEMYKEEFGDADTNSSPDPSPRTPTTNKPWAAVENTITETGDDAKPTFIPSVGLKGCTARLGFQNGAHEQIDDDFKTMTPKKTIDGDSSGFHVTYGFHESNFMIAKQVSLALGLEQGQKDSLLIASSEPQFDENYEEDYHCVDPSNKHQINDPNFLPDFVA